MVEGIKYTYVCVNGKEYLGIDMNTQNVKITRSAELILEKCLKSVWSIDTCCPKNHARWNKESNPWAGQCLVTALIVQDYFGGDLWYCKHYDHYWNKLENDLEIDLTINQFPPDFEPCFDCVKFRKTVLNDKNLSLRYNILRNLVDMYKGGL